MGGKGNTAALAAVLPQPQGQLCSVPKGRHRLRYGPGRERRAVAADWRAISGATPLTAAAQALERGADPWGGHVPSAYVHAGWPPGTG